MSAAKRSRSNAEEFVPLVAAVPMVDVVETATDVGRPFSNCPTSSPVANLQTWSPTLHTTELQMHAVELTARCSLLCADLIRALAKDVLESDKPSVLTATNELLVRGVRLNTKYEAKAMYECVNGLLQEAGKLVLFEIPMTLKLEIINLTAYMARLSARLSQLVASTTAQQMLRAAPATTAAVGGLDCLFKASFCRFSDSRTGS